MKNKSVKMKAICLVLGAASATALAGCNNNAGNKNEDGISTIPELVVHNEASALSADEGGSFADGLIDILKMSGKSMVSGLITSLATTGVNALLKEMGFDTRSITEKKLDQLSAKMDELKELVATGYSNITRKIVEIHNKDVLDKVLAKIQDVRSPIVSEMATLVALSEKELDESYDKSKLAAEKETFYKGLDSLKFVTLSGNELWYAAENLATALIKPSESDGSLKLFDLYDETFGALETWDYMTIKPRTQFITYLAMLTNGLAELAKIQASYKASFLDEGDANRIAIETGLKNMATAVNALNEQFQKELLALDDIKKEHDENKLMVHRTRTSDSEGNLVIKKDDAISSRLFPATEAADEYNYLTFTHDEDNWFHDLHYGQWDYATYIYKLNASEYIKIHQNIMSEYVSYAQSLGYTNFTDYTVKDYLKDIGFVCYENWLYTKAKGLYIDTYDRVYEGKDGFENSYNAMCTKYMSFETRKEEADIVDQVQTYTDYIWSSTEYNHSYGPGYGSTYLCFVRAGGDAFLGKVDTMTVDYVSTKRGRGNNWSRLFKGYYTWSQDRGTCLGFLEKHKR